MKKVIVLKVVAPEKPKRGDYSPWDTWKVTVQDPDTKAVWDCYKSRDEYKAFELEQKLLSFKDLPVELLEEYRQTIYSLGCDSGYDEGYSAGGGDL